MTIKVIWDNDETKTILRYDFIGNWTWNEFYAASAEFHAELDRVNHKVDTIINLTGSTGMPGNVLSHAYSAFQNQHPNDTGLNVIVSKGMLIQILVNTFSRVYSNFTENFEIHLVSSLEEARNYLSERRALQEKREQR